MVINSADKSSTVVVQNKEDYIRENLEHLNDQTTYQPLEGDPTDHICQQIKQKLQELKSKGYLSPTMYEFCLPPPKARLARFYSLKKMHKSPPTIRPIVSTCNSPTENISQFLDYWLQPSVKTLPSYIQDTSQFIRELTEIDVPREAWLVTMDVKSLYTNIPHSHGIQTCKEALTRTEKTNPEQPPVEVLTQLLEIVLKNNIFEFNGKAYKQIQGTAMGSKASPSYANLFMGKVEETFLSNKRPQSSKDTEIDHQFKRIKTRSKIKNLLQNTSQCDSDGKVYRHVKSQIDEWVHKELLRYLNEEHYSIRPAKQGTGIVVYCQLCRKEIKLQPSSRKEDQTHQTCFL